MDIYMIYWFLEKKYHLKFAIWRNYATCHNLGMLSPHTRHIASNLNQLRCNANKIRNFHIFSVKLKQ